MWLRSLLPDEAGDEASALKSVFDLFEVTRKLLREKGRKAQTFSKIAIVVLNQKIRPFTAKWHRQSLAGTFSDSAKCQEFRCELVDVQQVLGCYAGMLAGVAGIEDFQELVNGPLDEL